MLIATRWRPSLRSSRLQWWRGGGVGGGGGGGHGLGPARNGAVARSHPQRREAEALGLRVQENIAVSASSPAKKAAVVATTGGGGGGGGSVVGRRGLARGRRSHRSPRPSTATPPRNCGYRLEAVGASKFLTRCQGCRVTLTDDRDTQHTLRAARRIMIFKVQKIIIGKKKKSERSIRRTVLSCTAVSDIYKERL